MNPKMLQLLRRMERKDRDGVPRADARRIGCEVGKDVGGDAPIDALLSRGYAVQSGEQVLRITEAGRRALRSLS